MKKAIVFAVTVLLAASVSWVNAAEPSTVSEWIAAGDSLSDAWQHDAALAAYEKALEMEPDNVQALIGAGSALTSATENAEDMEKDARKAAYGKAAEYIRKAVALDPENWEGHFELSVTLGRLALFTGGKEKLNYAKEIKAEAEKAVALNPQADRAWHVLGRWHQNMANLSWALKAAAKVLFGGTPPSSNEEAVEAFKKAIEINPTHIEHYLELARTYDFMGKKELMREPLEKVLALPAVKEDDPKFKQEAKEMLADLD